MDNISVFDNRSEALEVFNDELSLLGLKPLSDKDFTDYWSIGVTIKELREWARDYASEEHSERCAAKNAWRFEP